MDKQKNQLAFSLIELSIVVLIIGILIAGVTQGSRLVRQSKLATARSITNNAPVSSISGLILWLDATRLNSLQNANSEFEVQDQDLIQNWYSINPQLTESIIANQDTSVNQPTYVISGINGLPSVSFNGTSSNLAITDSATISPDFGITLFAVVQFSNFGGVMGIVSKEEAGSISNPPYVLQVNSSSNISFSITKTDNTAPSTAISGYTFQLNTPYAFWGSYGNPNGVNIKSNLSGTIYNAAAQGSMARTNAPLRIGQQKSFFGRFLAGYISEIIIFNRQLKNSEINDINKYLTQKYGITFA